MKIRFVRSGLAAALAAGILACASMQPALAQSPFYAGKTISLIVGLDPGGTVDTLARLSATYLQKHTPGEPAIIVRNMPGAGGLLATNYLAEKAAPDGLTILWGPWDPLAQALKLPNLRVRYEDFAFIGGVGDTRILYARTDTVPGGMKAPADIGKASQIVVGALNSTDTSGLMADLALRVLGLKTRMVVGYRGGNDIFLAMQRGEVQAHTTSIGSFRSRNAEFIKSGQGIGLAYMVPVGGDGRFRPDPEIRDMPAFPDLYRQIHGRAPEGPLWDATNWLVSQIGEMTYVALAPRDVPPAALQGLQTGFAAASADPDFVRQSVRLNGVAYSTVDPVRGREIVQSLARVSPAVLGALQELTGSPR